MHTSTVKVTRAEFGDYEQRKRVLRDRLQALRIVKGLRQWQLVNLVI